MDDFRVYRVYNAEIIYWRRREFNILQRVNGRFGEGVSMGP